MDGAFRDVGIRPWIFPHLLWRSLFSHSRRCHNWIPELSSDENMAVAAIEAQQILQLETTILKEVAQKESKKFGKQKNSFNLLYQDAIL